MADTVKTIKYDDCTVRVHIPDLTAEEREMRLNNLKRAAAKFMAAVEKGKVHKNGC